MSAELAALYRAALEAIGEALDIPIAAIDGDNFEQRRRLLERRTDVVVDAVRSVLLFEEHPHLIRQRIEDLRVRISQRPVTYRPYVDDDSDCGPACSHPTTGDHADCPGPAAGATVVASR